MSVYLCIPSARPPAEVEPVIAKWREMGYRIALFLDSKEAMKERLGLFDRAMTPSEGCNYPGYAEAVNILSAAVLEEFDECDWIIAAGDDTLPDPNKPADEIAAELKAHFGGTFGVMQPTGDRFAGGSIDRIAGSAWLGREWCLRINQGRGPLWTNFYHMHVDECLQEVAMKLGVFWQRPDLVHLHRHFMRESDAIDARAVRTEVPEFLKRANSPEEWAKSKAELQRLRDSGFAECMPL